MRAVCAWRRCSRRLLPAAAAGPAWTPALTHQFRTNRTAARAAGTSHLAPFRSTSDPDVLDTTAGLHRAYLDYWNHIKFRKGWSTPRFSHEEVLEQLREAADMAALVQLRLDDTSGGTRLRQRGGNAVAFLDTVGYHPPDNPRRFVRDLVHHTLRDAAGYTEGASEALVDAIISELVGFRRLQWLGGRAEEMLDALEQVKDDDRSMLASEHIHKALLLLREMATPADTRGSTAAGPASVDVSDGAAKQPEQQVGEVRLPCIADTRSRVESLLQEAQSVTWEDVKQDPDTLVNELDRLHERARQSSTHLLRDLLALQRQLADRVSAGESLSEDTAAELSADRGRTRAIHQLLEQVDEMSHQLQVLRTAAGDEAERQKLRAEEAKRAEEEARRAEEERREAERLQEQRRLAEEREVAQRQRQAEERQAQEEERQAAERRRRQADEERQRQAERARAAERERLAAEKRAAEAEAAKGEDWRPWLRGLLNALRDPATWTAVNASAEASAPEFTTSQRRGHVVIECFCPGLLVNESDVKVTGNTLTIQGCRAPGEDQVRAMFKQLLLSVQAGHTGREDLMRLSAVRAAHLCAGGRYGRFHKVYKLPRPVPPQAVRAGFHQGVLEVRVPKEYLVSSPWH